MISFVIVASLMVALALAFILPPLLRKNQGLATPQQSQELNLKLLRDQFQDLENERLANSISEENFLASKAELERRAAEEIHVNAQVTQESGPHKKLAIALGVAIPVIVAALYVSFGERASLTPGMATSVDAPNHEIGEAQIAEMVKGLEERLQKEPNNPDGWYMLARSYNTMKRYDKAVQALEQLNKLVPNNADLLADYADTLAMTQNQSLQGAPEKLINQAIALDPKNVKALSLSGSAAFERREYRQAIAQWKRVLPLLASDTEMTKITLSNIGEAQSLLGETPDTGAALGVLQAATPESVVANPAPAVDSTSRLTGVVEIDASMRSKVGDDDAVFIFARAAQGARMPLVVLRKQVKDLPYKFTLDDSMSIAPDTHLKNHAALVVGARVSKNGNATPVSGDPEGLSTPVAPGASGIVINISSEHK